MLTYFDIIHDADFRNFVEQRIAKGTSNPYYSFKTNIPKLYKYQSLSDRTIDNLINGFLYATRIGDFNDLFDGTIHYYGSEKERNKAAKSDWNEMKSLITAFNLPDNLIKHDEYVNRRSNRYKTESRMKFRLLDYLGTYAVCLSLKNNSTLMWSHYASSNTGMCVEYDFNDKNVNRLQRQMLFPVAYSSAPIDIKDLIEDDRNKICKHHIEASVLCTALNKATTWKYENEWRLVMILPSGSKSLRRIRVSTPKPTRIILGYHFLKPFFYYDYANEMERTESQNRIKTFEKLLEYTKINKIPISIMTPLVGRYRLKPKNISVEKIYSLFRRHFKHDAYRNIKFYHYTQDKIMDMLTWRQIKI